MLITLLTFLFILSILVLVHEFGHFATAKKLGIRVEEFGVGLPPRIWGIKKGETIYSINWLPIGGFVKLYGEEEGELDTQKVKAKDLKKAFFSRPKWQRAIVLTAGVLMNFLLGWVVISFLFTQGVMVPTKRVHLEKVVKDSPAEKAGLKKGDIVKKLKIKNEKEKKEFKVYKIKSVKDLVETTKKYLGEEIILEIERGDKLEEIKITPRKEYPKDQGPMGVVISNYEEKKYSAFQAPFLGIKQAFTLSWLLIKGIADTLIRLLTFKKIETDVAGPIGIAQITGEAVRFGRLAVLELLGLLSINLAIINVLPFPALDGGRLLFVVAEAVTGKKLKPKWERATHQIGMAFLLALILLVTIHDVLRILGR